MEGTGGKQISVQILKQAVEARTRKLQARWTFESAQDAQAMHGIDVEAEIMAALAQEITAEIDQEILLSLRSLAATEFTYNQATVSGTATFVGDEHAALAVLVNRVANLIAQRTRRGAGNYAVVSSAALTVLQSATTSAFARTTEGTFEAPTNTKFVGTLNGTALEPKHIASVRINMIFLSINDSNWVIKFISRILYARNMGVKNIFYRLSASAKWQTSL
jgi:hypothetical protein